MKFRIDSFFKNIVKEIPPPKPEVKPQPQSPPPVNTQTSERQFIATNNRRNLENKLAENASPYKAIEQINQLPKPEPNDKAAVAEYKKQRAEIADNAIKNSQPPKIEDFRNSGLNGATASYEYSEALTSYNSQIAELKKTSADAQKYPDRILTPGAAVIEINNLPRPDRNDPQAIQEYNRQRAEIADSALLYAEPPKREDFRGLNGATASYEYSQALSYYNTYVGQLEEAANSRYSSTPPPITDAEADAAATELIDRRGGSGDISEDDAYDIGNDLSQLARTDPEGAAAVMEKVQEKLNDTDKGDNVASGFVNNLSVEDLRRVSQTPEGKAVLEDLQNRLLSGSVHDNEREEAAKIYEAIIGFNPNSLSGDPEQDAQTVDEQLRNLPPDLQESYVRELLNHPFGQNAIRFAAAMSPEGEIALGETLGRLYEQNPTETRELLRQITDAENIGYFPVSYHSGLGYIIGKSGSDDLIKDFAQHEIDKAKSNPDDVRGYLNAVTAYAGLSPEALQEVMETNPDFFTAVDKAGFLTGGPPSSAGFENPNIWEPGLGELLEKAAQVKDANGNATPEAIRLFEIGIKNTGANSTTMEGAGAFFIEHAEQLIDRYTDPRNTDTFNPEILQTFFAGVVYTPISDLLKYNGGSLVEAIVGDENGSGGVIEDVVQSYLDEAKQPNNTEQGRDIDRIMGQKIGYLTGAMTGGLLDSVKAYKDQWKEDKEFRDFAFNVLGKGLGKVASKLKLPGEILEIPATIIQKIVEGGAEDDKQKQLALFNEAFNELTSLMRSDVTGFEYDNENVEGLEGGYMDARSDYLVNYLINEWIGEG